EILTFQAAPALGLRAGGGPLLSADYHEGRTIMWLNELWRRQNRRPTPPRPRTRLTVESLEDRSLPTSGLSAPPVADIVPGSGSSTPEALSAAGGVLYFSAANGLWKSDGTAAGTVLLKTNVYASNFTSLNGSVFFSTGNSELWKTNGTPAGTVRVG